jgi:(1->4)-alpha-D-glucan 1-alpha-D-glucosylmutase
VDEAQQELESIHAALEHLPDRRDVDPAHRRERAREKEVIKRRLRRLLEQSPVVREALHATVAEFNGTPGVPTSFEGIEQMMREQSYRLASWRVAAEEINYRRFFDVNALAAIRMENPVVFERAHALLFRLLDERRIQGLRLDHTDGLYDPLGYFETLQRRFRVDLGSPTLNPDDAARPLPILVEKILEAGERLPPSWPVDGTTGYEFAASVMGLWVDASAEEAFTSFHRRFTGDARSYADHVYACKRRILEDALASEVNMLARQLERTAAANRRWRDFTLISLTRAIVEILAAFPVYRTYLREGAPPSQDDKQHVKQAIRTARARAPGIDPTVFDFLQDVLLLRAEGNDRERRELAYVALRFQQLTGPVMAKAVEDTAFYRYNRLLALNEVGSDPAEFGTGVDTFHAQNAERLRSWPLSMLTTSTHDTKRGEDAGARMAVLSEMPTEWQRTVTRWARMNERHKTPLDRGAAPTRRDEYTLYQALVGAWPCGWDGGGDREPFVARTVAYMEKATKEAKEQTSWTRNDPAYDGAVRAFIERILRDDGFVADLAAFSDRIGTYGATNGLATTLLRLCVPGIPDTYQGSELWNQSYVDPDNRRPVDFEARRALLAAIEQGRRDPARLARGLLDRWTDGAVKLYVLRVALETRARWRDVFLRGEYEPLAAGDHVVAFTRGDGEGRIVVVTPRLPHRLTGGERPWPTGDVWGDQRLPVPSGRYRDVFTGARHVADGGLPMAEILALFPVALLAEETL